MSELSYTPLLCERDRQTDHADLNASFISYMSTNYIQILLVFSLGFHYCLHRFWSSTYDIDYANKPTTSYHYHWMTIAPRAIIKAFNELI